MTVNATSLAATTTLTAYRAAGGDAFSSANQNILRDLVSRNVDACLSSLVSDLAKFEDGEYYDDVLTLCSPQLDYLAALEEAGSSEDWIDAARELNSESSTFDLDLECLGDERMVEDETLDRDRVRDEEAHRHILEHCRQEPDDARIVCEALRIDPEEIEIYEHWAVDSWFARKLADAGEKTGRIYNLTVWGRSCTGQSICMDSVIAEIAAGMEILEGQANDWSRK